MSTPKSDPNLVKALLSRAHSPTSTTRIYTEKIQHRPLHLKPTSPPPTNAQTQRRLLRAQSLASRKKKLKPRPLSSRQRRALCLYEIPRSSQKYAIYEPLNKMWTGYIHEVIGSSRPVSTAQVALLCSADWHGAEIEVVRSRCVGRVGIRGIVVKDSMGTFEVVTRGDRTKVVPKEHTIFRVRIKEGEEGVKGEDGGDKEGGKEGATKGDSPSIDTEDPQEQRKELIFDIHGDQFRHRAADRATKKFKSHFLPDL